MRKLSLLWVSVVIAILFWGCDKATDDNSTFIGTTWEANSTEVKIELQFINENTCQLSFFSKSNDLKGYMETFFYERGIGIDIFLSKNDLVEYVGNFINSNSLQLSKTVDGIEEYQLPILKKKK